MRALQQVLWAKAEGIEQQTCLHLLKRTEKTSIWSEDDDEEMSHPDLERSKAYSLQYVQQGREEWADELP